VENLGGRMRSLKKRGPHVLNDLNDLLFSLQPYQGAIQGPEEFAEGLALGVKSMLAHAVGESEFVCMKGIFETLEYKITSYFIVK